MPEGVSQFVSAYTSGSISRAESVRIQFSMPAIEADKAGSEANASVLSFSPAIQGKAIWEDAYTLVFLPESNLPSSTVYVASLNLEKLFSQANDEAASFEFDFRTRDLYFEVQQEGFQAPDPNNLEKQAYSGIVYASDVLELEEVTQLISAKQDSRTLDIQWLQSGASEEHRFLVQDISRGEKAGEFTLAWSGKPIGHADFKGNTPIDIPSLSDFRVVNALAYQSPQQYFTLFFSDPIKSDQQLEGLIRVQDYEGTYRYSIDQNRIMVYPGSRVTGSRQVTVFPGVRNTANKRMAVENQWELTFEEEKPQVRLAGRGVIMPNSTNLSFPFEAINLQAVDVEVFKIFNNNILQFLQGNELDGTGELERVGRIVSQQKVELSKLNPRGSNNTWTRYALDLSTIIAQDPSAIYQIRIGFRPEYSSYHCGEDNSMANFNFEDEGGWEYYENEYEKEQNFKSIWSGWYGILGWYDSYRWDHRNDPCYPAYYNSDQFIRRNVLASDLGIIFKSGNDGSVFAAVTDLRNANPVSAASIEIYDYQQQLIQTLRTGSDGTVRGEIEQKPFVAIARKDNQIGYLKLSDARSQSLSRFDVAGVEPQEGLKGYLYGERGVWRPGDSIFLNFVLEDPKRQLADVPISLELFDPRGQVMEKRLVANHTGGVYPIHLATNPEAITGNWRAVVKAGGASFSKTLPIETVKPNRLKVKLDLGEQALGADNEPTQVSVSANWLHGAVAQNLRCIVEMQVMSAPTKFDKYPAYRFTDPARSFYSDPQIVYEGQLNSEGKAQFSRTLLEKQAAPGKLQMRFKTRVFEQGGDFSADTYTRSYDPYAAYTGIQIPENKYKEKRMDVDEPGALNFVVVDKSGKPLSNRNLEIGVYRVDWRWWWDSNEGYLADYASSQHLNAIQKGQVRTASNGTANWSLTLDTWGRYLVRVCDPQSGHCTGDFVYAGYPWYDDEGEMPPQEAAMLSFAPSKAAYTVGETVEIRVPASAQSRVLLSIENGSRVLEHYWLEAKAGENVFKFKATPEMAPTVYANVSLIQAHAQQNNDLPIRMYGVVPISIEDPQTRLNPEIKMPDQLKPEQEFTVEISEQAGKEMSYTIALVDEGLLDLTRFQTPNPWDAFFAKEALGVRTHDVFDYVIGAYGGDLERLLKMGGDGDLVRPDTDESANRFKPVVLHAGPFKLQKGKKAKHTFTMPNYVGSVRAMVVASSDRAYGNADKTVAVKQPLMLLATLPRVLGPGERVRIPVNLFVGDDNIREVRVKIEESSGLAEWQGGTTQTVRFSGPGEKMAYFEAEIKPYTGVATFMISAESGNHKSKQEIEIDIRNPNPYRTDITNHQLAGNGTWTQAYQSVGVPGSNENLLEVSILPPINLDKHLHYLLQYPYGCLEQTLSGGFPQLYVHQLLELSEEQKKQTATNIQATIDRLRLFQNSDGMFAYWPGQNEVNHWSNTYAGHFLLEAKDLGYDVPSGMLDRWLKAQQKLARNWDPRQQALGFYQAGSDELSQAYRLYTLALAKAPEMGAMNRLREQNNLNARARWRLAAAYSLAGQQQVASALLGNSKVQSADYQELGGTFGSPLRDQAMVLETLLQLDRKEAANEVLLNLAENLGGQQWHSTQTLGYALLAIGKYAKSQQLGKKIAFSYQLNNGAVVNAGTDRPILLIDLPERSGTLRVNNLESGALFLRLVQRGQPLTGDETSRSQNLNVQVAYYNTAMEAIDPATVQQGTDFFAEVQVTHPGQPLTYRYEQLALDQIFASGWEITNTRFEGLQQQNNSPYDYQDIRDDRVLTFFGLKPGESRIYRVSLHAAYEGRYYLPAVSAQAMYNENIQARSPGKWVEVVKANEG